MAKLAYKVIAATEPPVPAGAPAAARAVIVTWRETAPDDQTIPPSTHTLTIPPESNTPAGIRQAIEADIARRAQVLGMSGTV